MPSARMPSTLSDLYMHYRGSLIVFLCTFLSRTFPPPFDLTIRPPLSHQMLVRGLMKVLMLLHLWFLWCLMKSPTITRYFGSILFVSRTKVGCHNYEGSFSPINWLPYLWLLWSNSRSILKCAYTS